MFATIIRSFLRPTRPDEDDHSSLHVHADVDRQRDKERWERERERSERERRRASRPRVHAPGAASSAGLHPSSTPAVSSGSAIELTPRYSTLTHGSVTGSTEPAQSVSELAAPVLDRTAVAFPAHGGSVPQPQQPLPIPHLPLQHTSPHIGPPVPTPQPKSARLATAATIGPVDGYSNYGGNDMGSATVEAVRIEHDGMAPLAPPQPSQSPAISEMDYRPMNISPGPAPSFIDPKSNPYQYTLTAEAVSAIDLAPAIPSVQLYTQGRNSQPVLEDSSIVHPGPSSSVAGVVGTGSGIPDGTIGGEVPKKRSHRKKSESKSKSKSSDKENEQENDKGKAKQEDHHSSSKKDKDRERRKESSKDKESDTRTPEEKERERRERKERKEKRREKKEKREAEKKEAEKQEAEKREAEKREAEKREAEKRETEKREAAKKALGKGKEVAGVSVPVVKPGAQSSKIRKDIIPVEKAISKPSVDTRPILGTKHGDGMVRASEPKKPSEVAIKAGSKPSPADSRQHTHHHSDSKHHSHSHHHHHHHNSAPDAPNAPALPKKSVVVRTPEEEAARRQRKADRAKARELKAAMQAAMQTNNNTGESSAVVNGAAIATTSNTEPTVEGTHHSHKSKSKSEADGSRKHKHRKSKETAEEKSERRAARRALELAESLLLETANDPPIRPTAATEKILSASATHLPIINPPPIVTPLSPSGRPFQPPSPIPELPELGDTPPPPPRNFTALTKEPKAYTESQIPPRPRTPPPAAYFSSSNLAGLIGGGSRIAQPEPRHYQEDKISVLQEINAENDTSRRKPHRTRTSSSTQAPEVVPVPVTVVPRPLETKEERRQRRSEREKAKAALPSQANPPSYSATEAAAVIPPAELNAEEHQEKSKRTPEESAARRARRDARKAEKVAAANAALHGDDQPQPPPKSSSHLQNSSAGPSHGGSRTRIDSAHNKGHSVKAGSTVGLHHDPRNEPGYGHYGYKVNTGDGPSNVGTYPAQPLPATTSGHRSKHTRKSVMIDEGARDEGPGYHRDGKEKERERERERIRKEKEKEAKAAAAAAAAAAASGKRFGRFSLKRSFSRLFTG
ncbi:hypothetical protein DFH27DRAFT_649746 [Peziza echinospora]|nr:hypothetical protein DFH27DRAFT_649746 [Peziza echinospora]